MEKDKRFSGNWHGQTGQALQETADIAASDTEGEALEVQWDAIDQRASVTVAALFGFAAGTLLVGLIALASEPTGGPTGPRIRDRAAAAERQLSAADAGLPSPTVQASEPWNFESAAPKPSRAPGRSRPDRLSAPDGWTYNAVGGVR